MILEHQSAYAAHEINTAHQMIQIVAAGGKSADTRAIAEEVGADKGGEEQNDDAVGLVDLLGHGVEACQSEALKLRGTRVPDSLAFRSTYCHM